jgi:hypothetical protein
VYISAREKPSAEDPCVRGHRADGSTVQHTTPGVVSRLPIFSFARVWSIENTEKVERETYNHKRHPIVDLASTNVNLRTNVGFISRDTGQSV